MEEEDHFTQTLLPLLSHCCTRQQGCCPWQPLTFSLGLSHSALSHSVLLSFSVPIYRQEWCHQLQLLFNKSGCQLQLFFNNDDCQPLTFWMGAHGWCNSSCNCCNCQWLLHINGNQPNTGYTNVSFFYNCTSKPKYNYSLYNLSCTTNSTHYSFAGFHWEEIEKHINYSLKSCHDFLNAPIHTDEDIGSLLGENYFKAKLSLKSRVLSVSAKST